MVVSMTQDEIIAMLRASCDKDKVDPEQNGFWVIHTPELEAFAKLVAEHEREACAKIVEANADACSTDSLAQMYLYSNANAIRARGQA
jgi:hypothetical protein